MGDDKEFSITIEDLDNSLNSSASFTVDVSSINYTDETDITFNFPSYNDQELVDFVTTMPSITKLTTMCELYPGLAKAFENFKTAYNLVNQDYEGRKIAGEIDDDIPF